MGKIKKCKVVLLPNKGDATIGSIFKCTKLTDLHDPEIDVNIGQLVVNVNRSISGSNEYFEHQSLYITSNDEIKIDDKVYDSYRKVLLDCPDMENVNFYKLSRNRYEKIISSDDSSLNLPKPNKSFIEKYVRSFNTGDTITQISVEYDYKFIQTYPRSGRDFGGNEEYETIETLLINDDNTISIKDDKSNFSREEVKQKMRDSISYALLNQNDTLLDINNWIEENL